MSRLRSLCVGAPSTLAILQELHGQEDQLPVLHIQPQPAWFATFTTVDEPVAGKKLNPVVSWLVVPPDQSR